jgi:transcriptional regulator with XRE-family HTH domain
MPYKVLGVEGLISLMKDIQGRRSRGEFAESLGVTTSYLSHIYRGRREPSNNLLLRMGVTAQTAYIIPEEIFNGEGQKVVQEDKERKPEARGRKKRSR